MSIKLRENIAASGSHDGYTQQELYINGYYDDNSGTWKIIGTGSGSTALYYVGSKGIQDTGLQPVSSKGLWVVPGSGSAFSGCLA